MPQQTESLDPALLRWDDAGLIPAVIQDESSREVRMLGFMNRESLERTLESGQVWFYSRSRRELWRKGATSGNTLALRSIYVNCEDNSLLLLVDPTGPTCHTGNRSCFYRQVRKAES